MTAESKNIAICPECSAEVRLKKIPFVGQVISCRHCDAPLEVTSRFPLELEWVSRSWEDEDDFEEGETYKTDRRRNGR